MSVRTLDFERVSNATGWPVFTIDCCTVEVEIPSYNLEFAPDQYISCNGDMVALYFVKHDGVTCACNNLCMIDDYYDRCGVLIPWVEVTTVCADHDAEMQHAIESGEWYGYIKRIPLHDGAMVSV